MLTRVMCYATTVCSTRFVRVGLCVRSFGRGLLPMYESREVSTENTLSEKKEKRKISREVKIYSHSILSSGNLIPLIKETKKGVHWGNPLRNYGCSLQIVELKKLKK